MACTVSAVANASNIAAIALPVVVRIRTDTSRAATILRTCSAVLLRCCPWSCCGGRGFRGLSDTHWGPTPSLSSKMKSLRSAGAAGHPSGSGYSGGSIGSPKYRRVRYADTVLPFNCSQLDNNIIMNIDKKVNTCYTTNR